MTGTQGAAVVRAALSPQEQAFGHLADVKVEADLVSNECRGESGHGR